MKSITAVAAIIKQDDELLLVKNKGDEEYAEFWTFPSGTLETGETAYEGLYREVKEESGAEVSSINGLAFAGHQINEAKNTLVSFLVFDVSVHKTKNLAPQDPDEEIVEAKFFTIDEVLAHLEKIPFDMMREPPLHYFKNNNAGKTPFWIYKKNTQGCYDVSMC